MLPDSWPKTVMFLCLEQQRIERLPMMAQGRTLSAKDIDDLCLQYAAGGDLLGLTTQSKSGLCQRFEWARFFAATLTGSFRMADGAEAGKMPYPDWTFESMMIWLLVDSWRLAERLSSFPPLPPRPEPPTPLGVASN